MGLLLYKSNEMFSATELIRKSKMIFDKIIDKRIDKAIILRDGKPKFLLMDFEKYENIMAEFEILKQQIKINNNPKNKKLKKKKKVNKEELKVVSKVVLEDVKKDEFISEQKEPKEEVSQQNNQMKPIAENKSIDQFTEEEELNNAFSTLEGMNFNEEMKKEAQDKIRLKVLQARKERATLLAAQEQELQQEDEEELQIKQHIEEEKLQKERELKEFWD